MSRLSIIDSCFLAPTTCVLIFKDSGDKRMPHEPKPLLQALNAWSAPHSGVRTWLQSDEPHCHQRYTRNCLSVHDHCFLSPICKTCWFTFCEVCAAELHEVWLIQGHHSAYDVNSLCSIAKDYNSACSIRCSCGVGWFVTDFQP